MHERGILCGRLHRSDLGLFEVAQSNRICKQNSQLVGEELVAQNRQVLLDSTSIRTDLEKLIEDNNQGTHIWR